MEQPKARRVLIHTDWIEVSAAFWTTDLFTRIPGYLLRRTQAVNPTLATKASLGEALENCNQFPCQHNKDSSFMRWQNWSKD